MFKKIICQSAIVFRLNKLLLSHVDYNSHHIIKVALSDSASRHLNPPKNTLHAPINEDLVDEIFKFKETNISNWIIEVIYIYNLNLYILIVHRYYNTLIK